MPTLTPYVTFDRDCRAAFAFYEQALGAEVLNMMTMGESPMAESCGGAAAADLIMHGCLRLPGGALLYGSDSPPQMPFQGRHGFQLALEYDSVDAASSAFQALIGNGGQVTMPLAPTFWAQIFGMGVDRFGVAWAINGAPAMSPGKQP